MTDQVIYSMVRVGKVYPPNKQVLRDISLGIIECCVTSDEWKPGTGVWGLGVRKWKK
jgi:hypothetical protein